MVRAVSASQAVKLISDGMITTKAATSDEVARHMEKGGTIQEYFSRIETAEQLKNQDGEEISGGEEVPTVTIEPQVEVETEPAL